MNLSELTVPLITPKSDPEVYRYISRVLGTEISEMVKPCYMPKLIKYFLDIQKYTGIDDEAIKIFKTGISKQYLKFNIYTDKYTILILIAVIYYLRKKKVEY